VRSLMQLYSWRWRQIWGEEKGAATAEYALLLALVVVVLIGSLTSLGGALQQKIEAIIGQLNAN
jgi:pilus assembly protein Flp/PilA